jgi:hypothetical protein
MQLGLRDQAVAKVIYKLPDFVISQQLETLKYCLLRNLSCGRDAANLLKCAAEVILRGKALGWRGVVSRPRDLIIFLTFAVILATLVGQGLTLKPLIAKLRLEGVGAAEREELFARVHTTAAASGARLLPTSSVRDRRR